MQPKSLAAKLLVTAAICLLTAVAKAQTTLTFQPATSSVEVGSSFEIDVAIAGAVDLYAYQLDVLSSSPILHFAGEDEGTFFQTGGGFIPGVTDDAAGSDQFIANTLLGPTVGIEGSGILLRLFFVAETIGDTTLSFANIIALDSTLSSISVLGKV